MAVLMQASLPCKEGAAENWDAAAAAADDDDHDAAAADEMMAARVVEVRSSSLSSSSQAKVSAPKTQSTKQLLSLKNRVMLNWILLFSVRR